MGITKLLERIFLGKKISKEQEEIREEIRDMKRKQKSEVARKGILAAHNDNMKISAHTRKIQERVAVEQDKLDDRIATVSDRQKGNRMRLQEIRENRISWKDTRTTTELMIIIAEGLQKFNEKFE